LSSPSGSGGAFNKFIDQLGDAERKGSDNLLVRVVKDPQEIFDAELAARLARPVRPDLAVRPAVDPRIDIAARVAQPGQSEFAPRTAADATRLTPRVNNLQIVSPGPVPTPAAPATDMLAGQKFLDELESWVAQADSSTPKSKPSR
jgi:hypothetical protein